MGGLEPVSDYDPGHQDNKKYHDNLEQEHGGILSADDKGYDEAFYGADSDYEKYSKHDSIYRQRVRVKW